MNPQLPGGDIDPMLVLAGTIGVLLLSLFASATMTRPQEGVPRGVLTTLGEASRVFAKNLVPLLLMSVLVGGLSSILSASVGEACFEYVKHHYPSNNPQMQMLSSELPNSLVVLVLGSTLGAFTSAFGLYFWVRHEKNEAAELYSAINYALNRLPRLIKPHAYSYGLIWLGNIVIIPGIWFALQFAFVDSIATLDDKETNATQRSQRLTHGRRGKIFRTFLFFCLWYIPYQLPLRYAFQGKGLLYVALGGSIDQMVSFLTLFCMVQYYLDIFRKPSK